MTKLALAIVAAASAATGAACTVVYFSSKNNISIYPTSQQPGLVHPAGLFEYGFPGPVNDLAKRHAFISSYDRRTRNPSWVVEHITPVSLATKGGDRKSSQFVEDATVPDIYRAKLKDYLRSGYDRGHQVPAADAQFSQNAMDDTFVLTNICPQVGDGFNRDYWSRFEQFCRRLTTKYPSVRIVTGPLYLPKLHKDGKWRVSYEVIGAPPNIAVPTHFYKVIVAEDGITGGPVAVGAFVLPNSAIDNKTPLIQFSVSIEMIERASGLEFLRKLPASRKTELCKQIHCDLSVREFNESRITLPGHSTRILN
ncbi:hypothetical protein K440DRAFT_567166 [Wilcoxina mikolae CBS 423.85]|nr:hypothetical protein K440DRAFT_567166 [Wilcoxina mikolae CBS 423.85]